MFDGNDWTLTGIVQLVCAPAHTHLSRLSFWLQVYCGPLMQGQLGKDSVGSGPGSLGRSLVPACLRSVPRKAGVQGGDPPA